jgi:hypothetical protein
MKMHDRPSTRNLTERPLAPVIPLRPAAQTTDRPAVTPATTQRRRSSRATAAQDHLLQIASEAACAAALAVVRGHGYAPDDDDVRSLWSIVETGVAGVIGRPGTVPSRL